MAFYVSVRDGERHGLLAGPFNRHGDALAWVPRAIRAAGEVDRAAYWYAYGTCHVKAGPLRAGRLNARLDLPTDGTRCTREKVDQW